MNSLNARLAFMANSYASSLHNEVRTKSYFFLQRPLKTRVNLKYQSKGSTYILHVLAFVEIRLFMNFYGRKNVRDQDHPSRPWLTNLLQYQLT